ARVAGVVERAADEATAADRAVDRLAQLDRVDAVGDAVEREADVALAELWVAAEAPRREAEVLQLHLDHRRVADLAGAVARGDDLHRRPAGDRVRFRARAVLAGRVGERDRGSDRHRGGGDGEDRRAVAGRGRAHAHGTLGVAAAPGRWEAGRRSAAL